MKNARIASKRNLWSLLMIKDDLAVKNLGGRQGAGLGPSAFEDAWKRINGKGIESIRTGGSEIGDAKGWSVKIFP